MDSDDPRHDLRGRAPAPALPGASGGATTKKSGPGQPWSHAETMHLLDVYEDRWNKLRRGQLKAQQWEDVAAETTARCVASGAGAGQRKTGTQCRHKLEKLRKRYRAERSRSAGRSKGPKWPFFPLLHDLAGGGAPDPSPNPIIKIKPRAGGGTPASPSSPMSSPSSEEAGRSRSLHGLISNGGGGSGLRFTIPKGSRTKPVGAPREARADRGDEDPEAEAMAEVASALRAVGEGFLRMEERRLEMSLQMEKERMDSEMKRTQTLLDAQQLFVEAFLGKQQQPHHKKSKLAAFATAAAMEED